MERETISAVHFMSTTILINRLGFQETSFCLAIATLREFRSYLWESQAASRDLASGVRNNNASPNVGCVRVRNIKRQTNCLTVNLKDGAESCFDTPFRPWPGITVTGISCYPQEFTKLCLTFSVFRCSV